MCKKIKHALLLTVLLLFTPTILAAADGNSLPMQFRVSFGGRAVEVLEENGSSILIPCLLYDSIAIRQDDESMDLRARMEDDNGKLLYTTTITLYAGLQTADDLDNYMKYTQAQLENRRGFQARNSDLGFIVGVLMGREIICSATFLYNDKLISITTTGYDSIAEGMNGVEKHKEILIGYNKAIEGRSSRSSK